jgi:hypothetical protein
MSCPLLHTMCWRVPARDWVSLRCSPRRPCARCPFMGHTGLRDPPAIPPGWPVACVRGPSLASSWGSRGGYRKGLPSPVGSGLLSLLRPQHSTALPSSVSAERPGKSCAEPGPMVPLYVTHGPCRASSGNPPCAPAGILLRPVWSINPRDAGCAGCTARAATLSRRRSRVR